MFLSFGVQMYTRRYSNFTILSFRWGGTVLDQNNDNNSHKNGKDTPILLLAVIAGMILIIFGLVWFSVGIPGELPEQISLPLINVSVKKTPAGIFAVLIGVILIFCVLKKCK